MTKENQETEFIDDMTKKFGIELEKLDKDYESLKLSGENDNTIKTLLKIESNLDNTQQELARILYPIKDSNLVKKIFDLMMAVRTTRLKYVALIGQLGEKQYKKLLSSAQNNLKSSIVLYRYNEEHKEDNFADSFNLFIQSVEKFGKVIEIFITNKPLKEDEMKRAISHETIKIFERRSVNEAKKWESIKKIFRHDKEFEKRFKDISLFKEIDVEKVSNSINKFLSSTQNIRKNREDIIHITEKEIVDIISGFNKDYEELKNLDYKITIDEQKKKEFRADWKKMFLLETSIQELNPDDEKDIDNFIENIIDNVKDNIKSLELLIESLIRLYFIYRNIFRLSVLTLFHYEITKYPDVDNWNLSPEIYIKELPIIKKLPDLIKIQEINLHEFDTIINEMINF